LTFVTVVTKFNLDILYDVCVDSVEFGVDDKPHNLNNPTYHFSHQRLIDCLSRRKSTNIPRGLWVSLLFKPISNAEFSHLSMMGNW